MVHNYKERGVDVIIPTYNSVDLTLEAIESVRSQTFPHWRLLVVDDGSDRSIRAQLAGKIEAFCDPRVEFHQLATNQGVAAARNFGVSNSSQRYIAFLDADDLWLPAKLETQIAFMTETGTAFSFTTYLNVDPKKRRQTERTAMTTVTYRSLIKFNTVGNSTVILDRQKLDIPEIPNLRRRQDFAFWLRILRQVETGKGLQTPLTIRRIYRGSLSHNKFVAIKDTWKMYRRAENMGVPKAIYFISCFALNSAVQLVKNRMSVVVLDEGEGV